MAKRIPSSVRWQAQRVWAQDQLWNEFPRPRQLAGATLGLIGVGSIGLEVARVAAALGMRVIAVREHPERGLDLPGPPQHAVYGPGGIDRMLAESDYVVVAAPITPQTRGLLNAERFAQMKRDAYLVNVSRGALVEEAALLEALRKRAIGGAALDVFDEEPLPPESPFWGLDNVLITPHSAGLTEKLWERHYAQISENLRRFLAGKPLLGQVNKRKGY
jgi:phosphoglycerate dehydrogenase-like enzyme